MPSTDPLLQPFQLKHLTLRNRIMSTSHEPAYSEDGMPKDALPALPRREGQGRHRADHDRRLGGGGEDSPAAFGNLHAYKDEIVPWLKRLADDCHEHGSAVMIQLTHLGRRTNWNHSDWLPVLAASRVREPAHRAFPKEAEDWDLERIIKAMPPAAERMQAAGLDGIELECLRPLHGRLLVAGHQQARRRMGRQPGQPPALHLRVLEAIRAAVGPEFIVGLRLVATRIGSWAEPRGGRGDRPSAWSAAARSTSSTSSAATSRPMALSKCDPGPGHAAPRRIWTSPARCARRPSSRCFTPPASTTWRPPATPWPRASSTWSA